MSSRARYILIAVILAVIIGGGGFGVYYLTSQIITVAGVAKDVKGIESPLPPGYRANAAISWLANCSHSYNGGASYQQGVGSSIAYDVINCTNTDADQGHDVHVDTFTLPMLAFKEPPLPGSCLDQSDIGQKDPWPPDHTRGNWGDGGMLDVAANHVFLPTSQGTCNNIGAYYSIQPNDQGSFLGTQTIHFDPGETKSVVAHLSHTFPECNYYQVDMGFTELDAAGKRTSNTLFVMGDVVRAAGPLASCPNAPEPVGKLEIKVFEDLNTNNEYGPPNTEGQPFKDGLLEMRDAAGVEIPNAKCRNKNTLDSNGTNECTNLTPGKYSVKFESEDLSKYDRTADTAHNPQKQNPITVTVPANGTGIAHFGYVKKAATTGDLLIRIFKDFNPKDNAYTPAPSGEGGVFNTQKYTVKYQGGPKNGQEIDYAALCPPNPPQPENNRVGGAGQDQCTGLEAGNYVVENTDDPVATNQYDGPIVTPERYSGTDPITVTVVAGQNTTVDFGYQDKGIGLGNCVLTTNPDPAQGPAPLTVAFDASGSTMVGGIVKYEWEFEHTPPNFVPDETKTVPTTSHTYANAGTFTAALRITNPEQQTLTCTKPVTVTGGPQQACIIAATPTQGAAPLPVRFTVTLQDFPAGNRTYSFNAGDGSAIQSGQTSNNSFDINYTYPAGTSPGNYTATVTINGTVTCTTVIRILQGPISARLVCSLSATPTSGPVPLDVNFTASVTPSNANVTYAWAFGDGQTQNTGTSNTTTHRYGRPGSYTATVTVTSANETASCDVDLQVRAGPIVAALRCDITKTVTDTDETAVENNTASPGELMTYNISWTCTGVPTEEPGASQVTVVITDDYNEAMMTVVPGSISDAGVDGPPPGLIRWTKVGAAQVRSGSESFQVRLTSPLAPGTYTIPNVAIITDPNGELDRDTTVTTVIVPPGPQVPDVEILKFVEDVNGGQVLPGDTLRYTVIVWNAGNTPLTATVTENIQANVNSFAVVSIPPGAQDSSLATGGTNGTGFLDVRNINLPNQGSFGTIVYTVRINAGVPSGTQLPNIVTATAGDVTDSDDENVTVGSPGPTIDPPPPPRGPNQVPPPLPTYKVLTPAPTGEAVSETGVSAQFWILLASLVAALAISATVIARARYASR